jgi:hypothetical protein
MDLNMMEKMAFFTSYHHLNIMMVFMFFILE